MTETTHNIGLVYFSQGEDELAIAALKRALRLDRDWKMVDDAVEAEALRTIGAAAWRLGQHGRAAADFRESLAVVRRTGNRYREAEVLDDLGQIAFAERRLPESSRLFEESLAIRRDLGDRAGICQSLTSLATARLLADRPKAALELAMLALDSPVIREQPDLLWPAQTVAGRAYRRLGRTADAKALLNQAIQSIEQIAIGAPASEGLGLHFFEDKLLPYHELIALSIERHELEEAIRIAERSKARVLTPLIGTVRADEARLLTDAEKRERGRLRDAVLALNRQMTDQEHAGANGGRMEGLASSRRDAREAVDAFEATLAARHPELATAAAAITPFTFTEANRIVTDRATAVVEYVVADDQLYAFLLTRDGARVTIDARALDVDRGALTRRTNRLRTQIASRDFAFANDARALYDTLLGPFRERLAGVTRPIIVPDGVLWSVPFQALRGPAGFLMEAAAVWDAPSMAALREIQRLPKSSAPRSVLAMARTEFGSSGLEPLPDAANQVQLIRDVYGPSRAAVFVDDAATETRFKAEAPRYSVLHLATHGVLEEASPLYSHLVLTASPGSPEEDGRLEAREIMRLKLTADLVVLAACDTGRGLYRAGRRRHRDDVGAVCCRRAFDSRQPVSRRVEEHDRAARGVSSAARGRHGIESRRAPRGRVGSAAYAALRTPVLLGRVHSRRRSELTASLMRRKVRNSTTGV